MVSSRMIIVFGAHLTIPIFTTWSWIAQAVTGRSEPCFYGRKIVRVARYR